MNGITIRSLDLTELFRQTLGASAVRTVLASGNVRFDAEESSADRSALKSRIEQALRDRFGYDAWIVLITLDELSTAIDGFPFDAHDGDRQPYILFAAEDSVIDELMEAVGVLDAGVDPVRRGDSILYWSPAVGTTTDSAFAKVLARSRYRTTTTTRNLRTLQKVIG